MINLTDSELEVTGELLYILGIETDDDMILSLFNKKKAIQSSQGTTRKYLIAVDNLIQYRSLERDPKTVLFRPIVLDKHFKVLIDMFMEAFCIYKIETTVSDKLYTTEVYTDGKNIKYSHKIENISTLLCLLSIADYTDEQVEHYKNILETILKKPKG